MPGDPFADTQLFNQRKGNSSLYSPFLFAQPVTTPRQRKGIARCLTIFLLMTEAQADAIGLVISVVGEVETGSHLHSNVRKRAMRVNLSIRVSLRKEVY